ncbi:hypothetical protein MKX74_08495 [Paenibacillus sp. FSL K6-1230]
MKHRITSFPRLMYIMRSILPMRIIKSIKQSMKPIMTMMAQPTKPMIPIKSFKYTACIVWGLLVLSLLAGCTADEPQAERHRGNATMTKAELQEAEHYVQQQGYTVVDYEDMGYEYTLERPMLTELPYVQYWSILKVEPLDYIGQKIRTVAFTVTNHPLDEMKGNSRHQTFVSIMLSEGKVIGGYS